MAGATELRVAAELCDPVDFVFHLADSAEDNGGGGAYYTTSNDAELLIESTDLDVFANDLGAQDGFHPVLLNRADYVSAQGCSTFALSVGDQIVADLDDPSIYFESSFLLRIDPAGDLEGEPDALWWLGFNHVVNRSTDRTGTGFERARLCFTRALPRQCELNGYGRDPDAGECSATPGEWQGCGADACAVCSDALADYPKYLENHPCCESTGSCSGAPSGCNAYCPAPSDDDR
jgi:hypothetical protein